MDNKKLILWGGHGIKNFGDDALLAIGVNILKKYFDAKNLVVVSKDEHYVQKMLPGIEIVNKENIGRYAGSKIIFNGGQQFFSYLRESVLFKAAVKIKKLFSFRAVVNKLKEISQNKNEFDAFILYAIGLGIGPFSDNTALRNRVKNLMRKMKCLYVRDQDSLSLCLSWNAKAKLGADLCYLDEFLPDGMQKIKRQVEGVERIGVIVRDWPHNKKGFSYIDPVIEAVNELRAKGKSIDYISLAPEYDKICMEKLLSMNEKVVCWDPNKAELADFAKILSGYSYFISARYHGTLIGALMKIPSICIELSEKVSSGANQTGLSDLSWVYPFNTKELIQKVVEMESKYSVIIENMNTAVQKQMSLAKAMLGDFLEVIEKT